MPAGAPYGNKNAEKWKIRNALQLFYDAIELSNKEEKLQLKQGDKLQELTGYKFDFIGEVARELGTYKSIFTELIKKFPGLKKYHNQLIENLEANCFCNTKKGMIREATGIVNLKSNHKWKDRVDNTTDDKPIKDNPQINLIVEGKTINLKEKDKEK
jgi:hypothetical protein